MSICDSSVLVVGRSQRSVRMDAQQDAKQSISLGEIFGGSLKRKERADRRTFEAIGGCRRVANDAHERVALGRARIGERRGDVAEAPRAAAAAATGQRGRAAAGKGGDGVAGGHLQLRRRIARLLRRRLQEPHVGVVSDAGPVAEPPVVRVEGQRVVLLPHGCEGGRSTRTT